ncbi:MAG TPA: DUF2167 domain-containing protein [Candidatus Acidoferrum sp.]|nr:DUF2167 domain-containing protein [Candidatus Acidoferrum sp.]
MNNPHPAVRLCLALFSLAFTAALARAEEPKDGAKQEKQPKIAWTDGPATARLGDIAEIKIPAGYQFTGKDGTRTFLEVTGNPPSGDELGTIVPAAKSEEDKEFWFVLFEFQDTGYIKDDDRDKLDPDGLLKTIRDNTEEANKERQRRGWTPYHIRGWYKQPFYDTQTKNLTWAMQGYSTDEGKEENSVNYSVRILGRRGTMNVDLVLSPALVDTVLPKFDKLLTGFSYLHGSAYADFRAGDKVAEYGLATLVAGGATAIAAKTGLLAKLWKLIVVGFAALVGMLKRWWNSLKKILSGKAAEQTNEQG